MEKRKILINSMFYTAASFMPMLVNFFMLPVYTRYITPRDFGILALTQVFGVFLPVFLSLQIHTSISRFYFDYQGLEQKILVSTLGLGVFLYSLVCLLVFLKFLNPLISFVFPNTSSDTYILFHLTLISSFFNVFSEFFRLLTITREKARLFMIISVSCLAVGLILNILEVVVFERGIYGMTEAALILSIVNCIVLISCNYQYLVWKFNFRMLAAPIQFALPVIPHTFSGIIFMYSDRIIMEKYVLLSTIGIYTISDKIASIIKTILTQIHFAFLPSFTKTAIHDKIHAVQAARDIARIATYFACLGISIFSLFSVEIIYYFLDKNYFEAWIIIPFLASAYIFRGLYCFGSSGLFFEKKTGRIAIITSVAAIINIILNLVLIRHFGLSAVVFSTIISFLATYLMTILISGNCFKVNLDMKSNLVFIGYMYAVILLAFLLNSRFTLEHPRLGIHVYILKFLLLAAGIGIGLLMNLFKLSAIKIHVK